MVNMFNMGKFNNVRLAHNTYIPTHGNIRQPQPRLGLFGFGGGQHSHCHTHCGPQNITINQGPQGFWGFMTGLCQGLFGGFFGGGMFGGFDMGNMYGMGMPGMYGGSLFNDLSCLNLGNTTSMNGLEGKTLDEILGKKAVTTNPKDTTETQTDKQKQLNELKAKYPNHTIVENEDGTYTVKNSKGETVKTGKYEDLIKAEEQNVEQQTSQNVEQQTSQNVEQQTSQNVEQQTSQNVEQQTSQNVEQQTSQNVEQQTSQNVEQQTSQNVEQQTSQNVEQQTSQNVEQQTSQNVEQQPTKPEPVGANKVQAGTYQDTFTIHDDVQGKSADINAKSYTFGSINSQGYPSNIKVNGRTYNFVEVKNGTAIYETVKSNGAREQYRLEQNPDSKYALNQYEGDIGAGVTKPTTPTQPSTQTISLAGKPVTINFYSDVKLETPLSKNGSNGGYARATVNNKTYTVSVGPQDSHAKVMQKLGEAMMAELKAAGYKDIKLTNDNFNFQMSENGEVKNVQNNSNIDWNNSANKAKPMKLNIEFSIKVSAGNVGTASVKLPNGEEITAWVGPSLTSQRARASLADDIQDKLQKAGWTNVTLVNDNFNWESGPKQD